MKSFTQLRNQTVKLPQGVRLNKHFADGSSLYFNARTRFWYKVQPATDGYRELWKITEYNEREFKSCCEG